MRPSTLLRYLLGACLAVVACSTALASPDDGWDVTKWRGFTWSNDARKGYIALDNFADCIVKEKEADVRAFLALPLGSDRVTQTGMALAKSSEACLNVIVIKFTPPLFRSALIAAQYRRHLIMAGSADGLSPLGEGLSASRAANCITLKDPGRVDALLRTQVGSREEKASWQALAPGFQSCNVSRGWVRSPFAVRYDLALAAYERRLVGGKGASE